MLNKDTDVSPLIFSYVAKQSACHEANIVFSGIQRITPRITFAYIRERTGNWEKKHAGCQKGP